MYANVLGADSVFLNWYANVLGADSVFLNWCTTDSYTCDLAISWKKIALNLHLIMPSGLD
jgi:hypothetical protein